MAENKQSGSSGPSGPPTQGPKQFQRKAFKYLKDDKEYQRPDKTFTEQLTREQIAERLQDYIQVDDMKFVRKGTHLRYYIPDKQHPGEMKFCVGGFLKFTHDEYLILSQSPYGKDAKSWSVQRKDAIFYRKLAPQETIDKKIHYLETENARLLKENEELRAQLAGGKKKVIEDRLADRQVTPVPNELDILQSQITPDEFEPIKVGKKSTHNSSRKSTTRVQKKKIQFQ